MDSSWYSETVKRVGRAQQAWIGLAIYVVLADSLLVHRREPTMSSAFREAVCHPRRRWPVIAAWAYLTLHLFGPNRIKELERRLTHPSRGMFDGGPWA